MTGQTSGVDWTAGLHTLAFVIVPNLPYVLLMTEYEVRPRTPLILLYWCVGVVAPKSPAWFVACAMGLVVSLDLVWLVSGLVSLHPAWVVEALRYAPLMYPSAAWLYLALGAAASATVIVPAYLIHRHKVRFFRGRLLAVGVMMAAIAADLFLTTNPRTETPAFASAIRQAGIEHNGQIQGNNSLLIVMVESLGVFAEHDHNELLFAGLRSEGITTRYRVREGHSPYTGATTGATSRELCGRWAGYVDYLSGHEFDCLPARLAAEGYATHAVHAYTGHMFHRFDWYPKIGFQHLVFEEQMRARGENRSCGTVFRSACDRAGADIVHELLTTSGDQPRFVYWLTVDSHMPIEPTDGQQRWDCVSRNPFGNETICLIAQIWKDVFEAVERIAMDPELAAPTTIMVVGDHPPGFVSRTVQAYFVPGLVPWIALEPRIGQHKD